MPRVLLIHWKAGEAPELLERLRAAGHDAEHWPCRSGADFLALRSNAPNAFVIDLSRLPSQGREVGSMLRRQKATRHVPLVFAGGETEKVSRVRALLPDAVYCEWSNIGAAIDEALRSQPQKPVVRDAMAGYSGAPLPKKLGIQANSTVILAGAPEDFARTLEPLPEGVRLKTALRGTAKLILLFTKSRAEMEERFPAAARTLEERGAIWIAWPKKASGIASDLSETVVRAFGLAAGFVDYKICAIDNTWSGLLFTRRRA